MRKLDAAAIALLGVILLLRYPLHFIFSPPYLMDFNVYRTVAERIVHGQAAILYAPTQSDSEMMVFKYAPVWALAWSPLAWLPAWLGAILWTAADLAALLITLVLCVKICRRAGFRMLPVTSVFAVLFIVRPLGEEMGNGQVNLLWGALMAGFVYATQRGRFWPAAAALAAAMLLKLTSAVFLPYLFLANDRRRLGLATLAIAAGTAAVSSLVLLPHAPWQLLADWWTAMSGSRAHLFDIGNQSIMAMLSRHLTADGYGLNVASLPAAAISALATGLLLACLAAISRPQRADSSLRFLFDSAMLTIAMAIFSPTCWLATYTVLVFPVFLALAMLQHRLGQRRADAVELALAALTLGLCLFMRRQTWRMIGLMNWRGETYLFLVFMILPWMGIALMAWLWRQRRMPPPRSA